MKRRTKIVCTLGPATGTREMIFSLARAGMNVARINCSHGDWEARHQWIKWIREAAARYGPIAVLVDLQGPKMRIGRLPKEGVVLKLGSETTIGVDPRAVIPMHRDAIYESMKVGERALLGDGEIQIRLISDEGDYFRARVLSGGTLYGRKGITIAGKSFDIPCLTDQDKNDILEAAKADADFIALSYVQQGSDMHQLRHEVEATGCSMRLVAKIETKEAIKNLRAVIDGSDAIMVARGDLGLQMDIEDVPTAQKQIIKACYEAGKPVITATQMLESMLHAARPTRAEASDVANAILDGTDAVMLSGETAAGTYPIQAVKVMSRLAEKAEKITDFHNRLHTTRNARGVDMETDAVARSAAHLADTLGATAIITTSTSGTTPRLISRYRPKMPIYCAAWNDKTNSFCCLVWGVIPMTMPRPSTSNEGIAEAINTFKAAKVIRDGDRVVITCGVPPGISGSTNLILVETIGSGAPL
jgi:pyruvate kinase